MAAASFYRVVMMKTVKDRQNWHLAMGFLALALALFASGVQADGILDSIVSKAEQASGGWMDKSLEFATSLFYGLAALEFIWAGVQLLLQRNEMSEVVVGLTMKVVTIGFFGLIIAKAPVWFPLIMESFSDAGAGIAGTTKFSPSGVFDKGVSVAATMVDKGMNLNEVSAAGMVFGNDSLGDWLLSAIIIGLSGLLVIIGYTLVALQLAITLIETAIIIGGGVLMLGFMGSRWTMSFGERVFGYMIANGAKVLTIYLIIGFGDTFTNAAIEQIAVLSQKNGGLGFTDYLSVGGASMLYGALGYLVPGMAGTMLNGSPSLSMSNVAQAGKGAAAMPVGAALSTGAAGARAMGLGAGGAAFLASKFGGGGGGGIGGTPPGGGGGGGSVLGTLGGGGGGKPGPGGALASDSGNAGGFDAGKSKAGPAAPTNPGTGQGGAGQSGAPGFQSPRSMDPDRRERDVMLGGGSGGSGGQRNDEGGRKEPGKLDRFSKSMSNMAREMQYASNRQQTGMGHDGNTGGAPSIRMNV